MPESGVFFGTLQQVLRGLPYTLLLTFVPLAFAFLPGLWFGWLRAKKSVVGSRLVGAYVTLFRSLPLVLPVSYTHLDVYKRQSLSLSAHPTKTL